MTTSEGIGPWARHYQAPYRDDAANPRYPLPIRVAFLAYGNHRANGHARFKQGEIATALGRHDYDPKTGELIRFVPLDRRSVYRAIQQAVDYGLLAPESRVLCLVVPGHRITGGVGDEDAPCDRHAQPAKASTKRTLRAVS